MIKQLSVLFAILLTQGALANAVSIYNCPIEYKEYVELALKPGADFPDVVKRHNPPKKRSELLKVLLAGDETIKIVDAALSLPSFMLITKENQDQQRTFLYEDENLNKHFEIYWSSWYFGSSVDVTLLERTDSKIKVDLYFDDHDGVSFRLSSITCPSI